MKPELAQSLMHSTMQLARQDIANNELCNYMRGYYIGLMSAYSTAGGTVELINLLERYRHEVRHANKEAA